MKTMLRWAAYRQTALIAMAVAIIVLLVGSNAEAVSRDERIAQARRDWLIGLATEKRIAAELARYQASDQASPEVIQLYETYLDRVRRLTEEKRRILEALEGRRGPRSTPAATPGSVTGGSGRSTYDPQIPEDQELDEIKALNEEFDRSLAAFDDLLLREIEQSRIQSELKMKKLAREAAQAAKSLRAQGQMEGSEETEQGLKEGQSSGGGGNETGKMEGDRQSQHQQADGAVGDQDAEASQKTTGQGTDLAKAKNKQQKGAASGESGPPGDGASLDTQDDDIVARQLREAAEKETDPELKEKLWKEYHDYKKSI